MTVASDDVASLTAESAMLKRLLPFRPQVQRPQPVTPTPDTGGFAVIEERRSQGERR
jgi:hypothetical protein